MRTSLNVIKVARLDSFSSDSNLRGRERGSGPLFHNCQRDFCWNSFVPWAKKVGDSKLGKPDFIVIKGRRQPTRWTWRVCSEILKPPLRPRSSAAPTPAPPPPPPPPLPWCRPSRPEIVPSTRNKGQFEGHDQPLPVAWCNMTLFQLLCPSFPVGRRRSSSEAGEQETRDPTPEERPEGPNGGGQQARTGTDQRR